MLIEFITPCQNDIFISTSVNRALAYLHHQVLGAATGELSNFINFLIAVKIFLFLSFFLIFFLLSFFLLLTSWVLILLCEEAKVLVNSFPRSKGSYIKESEKHE